MSMDATSPQKYSLNSPIHLPSAPLPPSSLPLPATSSSLPPDLSTVIASLSPASSPVARTKDGLIRMLLQSSDGTSPDPNTTRLLSLIQLDHSYSKPWNWRPESSLCQPTKTLFVPRVSRAGAVETECDDSDGFVDVVTDPVKQMPGYDVEKAKKFMGECERFTCFTRPSFASLNTEEDEEEEMMGWEEKIPKENWSQAQGKLFSKVMKVLVQDRLARLAGEGGDNEPILRRLNIDKSCKRMRSVLASPPCTWDRSLVQWLHNSLSTYLPRPYLASWLDILQSLRAKVPGLMERILAGAGGHHIDPQARSVSQEGLLLLLRRPWDPTEGSMAGRRLARLPGNPILVVAPPGLDNRENKTISNRMRLWNSQLGCLGKVIVINMPSPRGEAGARTSVNFYLHQMVSATLNKVREIKNTNERPVIVLGWGPGAAIAAHVASIERCAGLVCLGFPVSTLAGVRGQVGDTLLDLKTPGLFVVGERSSVCNTDDIEDIREKMSVETGLVIVGGADDKLRLTTRKKKCENVTQSMVDKSIIDQIRNFLVSVLIKQSQAMAEKDLHHPESFVVPVQQEGQNKKFKAKKRVGDLGFMSPNKKFKAGQPGLGLTSTSGPPGPPLLMMQQKLTPKKSRKPKKKNSEGEQFTLSSGTITPLPASLLSISTPLPPVSGSSKDTTDPPPLPIRIPFATSSPGPASPSSPTPRVIHYAGRQSATEVSSPTWTVAVTRPMASTRPASGQVILSSLPHTSPTKLVTNRQSPALSPRSNTVQIQLPSPGLQLHRGQPTQTISPEKLLILMSPNKDGSSSTSVSPTKDQGGLVVSPGKGLIMPQGRILLQTDRGGAESGGLVLSPTKTPTLKLPSPTRTTSGQVSQATASAPVTTAPTNLS